MNPKIMSRPMFSGPKQDVNNVGIMQGFAEDDGEEMGMEPEQEAAPSDRSPSDPEVLMNNLRGDYRSVDARYMELAQMVGEEAASQTPPEVLAMLQMQMAPPAGGIGDLQGMQPAMPPAAAGIAGLPQAPQQPMPQPQQAMPPGMAGAAPFPQGGAEQAPPTPDGLPPAHAVVGGLMTQAARLGPYLAGLGSEAAIGARLYGQQLATAARPYTERVATAARPYMEAGNQY